ncbi:MAG: antibiotic ABC transporter ATP-binding protein [Acidobacteria bacterium]|nr:MAG: antibiotic ABC transporter ATP-binding protein [Acidobacteriota bacterium]PYR18784.1 MAG: antibiotic ABC transporter ATP-binding protein [Acidobacteriota bacterium]
MRRLLEYLRPYWRQVAIALVTIVVGGIASLMQPYLIKVAIDRFIAARRMAGLDSLAALYLAVLVVSFAAEYVQTWTMQLTGQRIMFDLRMAIYRHLQRLDLRYYDRHPVGRLMTRVTSDVDVLNDLFTAGVVTVFGDVFTLVGIMAMMLWMNWRLALVAFSVLPIIFLVTQWFRRNVRDSYRVVRGWIARINAFLQENITGMSTVQLFRREALNFARFDEIDRKHRDANIESIFYYAVFYPAIEAVATLASALIIWYGGGGVMSRTLTLGALVAFLQYSQRFFRPISDMSEKFNVLQAAMASSERIFKLLDEPVAIESPALPARRPAPAQGHIVFDGVWFTYNEGSDETWVLKGISFDVRPGERVGIVGATGSGKTTLINLLLRFYDVKRGRITIDGVDIRRLDLADVRGLFSLVLQDVHLFSGTIADNIRLGHPAIDDERVRRAAGAVHAEPFIERLPDGYASAVAERGSTLSVGQKQLLSFARALAFDPRVLILDEATSSVDTETELIIRDALRVLMAGRTTIAIAHRLSTIQDMDKILVLHKGQLRESGTHQELLAHRGIYFKLFELQYKGDERVEVRSQSQK